MAGADRVADNRAPLDWLSFLLADVKDGIGPFLAVFLTGARHTMPYIGTLATAPPSAG